MPGVFQTEMWAVKVPSGWAVDDSDETIVFEPTDDGDGALLVSAFYKDSAIAAGEMLDAIQSSVHGGAPYSEIHVGEFSGFHAAYTRYDDEEGAEVAWRVWCVFCETVHLYVTYNCSLRFRGKHDKTVDAMLRTLMCLRETE